MGLAGKSKVFVDGSSVIPLNGVVRHRPRPNCANYQLNLHPCVRCRTRRQVQQLPGRLVLAPDQPPRHEHRAGVDHCAERIHIENGATLVVPGSHLWEPDRLRRTEAVQAVMSAGSVVFYLAPHITGRSQQNGEQLATGRHFPAMSSAGCA
jgi:hypothetical protein